MGRGDAEPSRILLPLVLTLLLPCGRTAAQPDPYEPAEQAIEQNQLEQAQRLIEVLLAQDPSSVQGRFLLGQIASRRGDYRTAIAIYRAILARHPGQLRVRLELARALFLDRQYGASRRNFEMVLAADVPPLVRSNVNAFLDRIKVETKDYTFSISAAALFDSNANAATNTSQVTLFGLPFTLSPSARQQPGYGVAIHGVGEYDPALDRDWKLRLGGSFYRHEYQTGHFDDMEARGFAGLQYAVSGTFTVSLLGTYGGRWFANLDYNRGGGPRIELDYVVSERLRVQNATEMLTLSYQGQPFLSGHTYSNTSAALYRLTDDSYLRATLGIARENTSAAEWSDWAGRIGVGYHVDFAAWSFELQPQLVQAVYDTAFPLFNVTRRDRIVATQLTAYAPVVAGMRPFLGYTYTNDMSDIAIFAYSRHIVQLGFTADF